MESYGSTRFEAKIETFDPCAMDLENPQRRTVQCTLGETRAEHPPEEIAEIQEIEDRPALDHQQQQQCGQIATVQPNAMTNMTLTPVRLPALLDGEFFSVVRVEDSNVTVRCLQCEKLLNGNLKSTGNFLSHIKRVHPFMIERIKCKSNQRKPAVAYIDMTPEKSMEIVKSKRGYRKCYKPDVGQMNSEDIIEQPPSWPNSPTVRRRKYDETADAPEIQKLQSNNSSFVVEDEFDAIGRNVAAKLRNMRLDQRIVAEKLLNDVMFEAQLGTLHRDSSLHV